MQDLRSRFLVFLLKDIQDEGAFPDPTGNEVTKAGNIIRVSGIEPVLLM